MTDTFKDLDALVPNDKRVLLGGVEYTIPGDMPLEIYVTVNKAGNAEDEEEQLDTLVGALVGLFVTLYAGKPEEERVRANVEKALRARGIRFNLTLLRNIYNEDIEVAENNEDPQ